MIKFILTDDVRVYVPLSRVVSISEYEKGQLVLCQLIDKDEILWRPLASFEILSAGRKQS